MTIEKTQGLENRNEQNKDVCDSNEELDTKCKNIDKLSHQEKQYTSNHLNIKPDVADSLLAQNNQNEQEELDKTEETLEKKLAGTGAEMDKFELAYNKNLEIGNQAGAETELGIADVLNGKISQAEEFNGSRVSEANSVINDRDGAISNA